MNDPIFNNWLFKVNQVLYSRFLLEAPEITSYKKTLKLYESNKTPIEAANIIQNDNESFLFEILDLIDFDNTVNSGENK